MAATPAAESGAASEERVPIGPFVSWLEDLVRRSGRIGVAAARLEVDEAQVRRWLNGGGARDGTISVDRVDEVLLRGDAMLWEVYPHLYEDEEDEDFDYPTRWCAGCAGEAIMGPDGLCSRCGTSLERTRVPPVRRGERSGGRPQRRYLVAPRPGSADFRALERPEFEYEQGPPRVVKGPGQRSRLTDATLREALEMFAEGAELTVAAELLWREDDRGYGSPQALYGALRRQVRRSYGALRNGARPRVAEALAHGEVALLEGPAPKALSARKRLDAAILHEAAWLYYYDGLGFDRAARRLWPRTRYKSHKSLSRALYDGFKEMGWPRRDRIEATRAVSYKHGLAPREGRNEGKYRAWRAARDGTRSARCAGATERGPDESARCRRPAARGSRYCRCHDPALREWRLEVGQRASAGRIAGGHLVPSGPLRAYLLGRKRALGLTNGAIGEAVGMSRDAVGRLLKSERGLVRRSTAERCVAAFGHELGDLYDEDVP